MGGVGLRNILVTGGAGFIGSNFLKMIVTKTDYNIVNLDKLTYAGNYDNIKGIINRHIFIKGDICDTVLLDSLFDKYDFDTVVNFAAESHVDRSIEEPDVFIQTNICGTQKMLDVCKKKWSLGKTIRDDVLFLQVSTDEVYGSLGKNGKFSEITPIAPNSPYSASKASADLLVKAYNHTYGLPVLITRCSNNYGPNQFPEKLIPLTIMNALNDKKIPIYGDGKQIRDWIFVRDHCEGILTVLKKGLVGEVYNIGSENEWANIDIVNLILEEMGKPKSLIEYVKDRPGHDTRYAIDNSKIKDKLGWKPKITFEKGMKETIQWYLDNQEWINDIVSGNYLKKYFDDKEKS